MGSRSHNCQAGHKKRINTDAAALAWFLSFEYCRKFYLFSKLSALNGSALYYFPAESVYPFQIVLSYFYLLPADGKLRQRFTTGELLVIHSYKIKTNCYLYWLERIFGSSTTQLIEIKNPSRNQPGLYHDKSKNYILETLVACNPLGPCPISNWTWSPSSNDL